MALHSKQEMYLSLIFLCNCKRMCQWSKAHPHTGAAASRAVPGGDSGPSVPTAPPDRSALLTSGGDTRKLKRHPTSPPTKGKNKQKPHTKQILRLGNSSAETYNEARPSQSFQSMRAWSSSDFQSRVTALSPQLQESQPSIVQQLPACSRAVAALSARHIPAWSCAEQQHLLKELAQQALLTPKPAAHAWHARPTSTAEKRKQPTAPVLALPVLLEEEFVR